MITKEEAAARREFAAGLFRKAGIYITEAEKTQIETADFGLDQFAQTGLGVLVYINTQRCCAKELAIWPRQTCPEHRHPPVGSDPGKEETFRCRWGDVLLYVPGEPAREPKGIVPAGYEKYFTVWHEVHLRPGEQYTLSPEIRHWFQAGPQGAVVSEFSTRSRDEYDVFTDPRIVRKTHIVV